jgi:hypothetical protein
MTGICNKMTVLSAHVRGLRFQSEEEHVTAR